MAKEILGDGHLQQEEAQGENNPERRKFNNEVAMGHSDGHSRKTSMFLRVYYRRDKAKGDAQDPQHHQPRDQPRRAGSESSVRHTTFVPAE